MKEKQSGEQKRISQDRIIEIIAEYANGSQQELCDACGVAKSSISQYVNRTNAPGNITAAKIATRYGLNPLWVMGFPVPKTIKSDADGFRTFAEAWNAGHPHAPKISDKEFDLIKKYRYLDDHGKDMVDTVINKEYDRCKEEAENTVELSEAELENLKLTKYLNDKPTLLVARKKKGD